MRNWFTLLIGKSLGFLSTILMTNKESDLICTQPCRDSGNIFLLVKHSAFMTRKCGFYVKDCCTVLQIRTMLKCREFHIATFKLIMQYVLQGQVLYTSLHTFVTYRSRFVFDFETVLLSTFICMHELGLVVRNWRV